MYSWCATDNRAAKGIKRRREHVFVVRNRQSRGERDKEETRTCIRGAQQTKARRNGYRGDENMYSWCTTDKREAKVIKRRREHVFVARNRQSRGERDKEETRTCIRGAQQTIARRKG